MLQQVASREDAPAAVLLLAGNAMFQLDAAKILGVLHREMRTIVGAAMVTAPIASTGQLQLYAGAKELQLCPELVPCLAVTMLVTVLRFDAGAGGGRVSSSSTKSSSGAGSSRHRPASGASAGHDPARSGSSTGSGRLGNGVSLDSLTPLACGLFGLLGVDQDVLLQAAGGARGRHSTSATVVSTGTEAKDETNRLMEAYCGALEHQVSRQQLALSNASLLPTTVLDPALCFPAAERMFPSHPFAG
jgi:hypothetical protein